MCDPIFGSTIGPISTNSWTVYQKNERNPWTNPLLSTLTATMTATALCARLSYVCVISIGLLAFILVMKVLINSVVISD